jgi:hypothetical protein
MSRYRLHPSPAQEAVLRDHCAQARYVWNLATGELLNVPRLSPGYAATARGGDGAARPVNREPHLALLPA